MSEPIVWENIPKSQSDPTTIEEAIADGLEVHNADTNAHMQENESLEQHRSNSIIDHPAESAPNDKLFGNARAYTAIVDPTSEEDYDTIASAVAYAADFPGAKVLIMPGVHYLGGEIIVPRNVDLLGVDPEATLIVLDPDNGDVLSLEDSTEFDNKYQTIENIGFTADSDGGIVISSLLSTDVAKVTFTNCIFGPEGNFIRGDTAMIRVYDCYFNCNNTVAVGANSKIFVENTTFFGDATSSGLKALGSDPENSDVTYLYLTGVQFLAYGSTACIWVQDADDLFIEGCEFNNLSSSTSHNLAASARIHNSIFALSASSYVSISFTRGSYIGNSFSGGSGNRLRFSASSVKCIAIGNNVGTSITDAGTANVIANNVTS